MKKEEGVKQEEGVKMEGVSIKREDIKLEPRATRARKRALEMENGSRDTPTKRLKGSNQDTLDKNTRKWDVVPAQQGRFVLSPTSMSWIKVGSDSYNALLANPFGKVYLGYTPVILMDGRRWSSYCPPKSQAARRKLPADLFLIPELRKYPVATKAGEKPWSSGLRAAMARARLPSSRNAAVFAKALELMIASYKDQDQSLPGVKSRSASTQKVNAFTNLLSERLVAHPDSRPEDMPPLEKVDM